jgi:hypothetical protein
MEKAARRNNLPQEAEICRTNLGVIQTARRNPSLRNLIRIARALELTMAGFFQDEDSGEGEH